MKALSRCMEPGWLDQRAFSFVITFCAYAFVCLVGFLGYVIYQTLPPMDWEDILKTCACVLFFCLNWYLIDRTIWD